MGQYWKPVNIDKCEYINPHKLGCGLKLGEQLGGCVGDALVILCAAMRERRGGGDFDWDSNFYGPERTTDHSGSAPLVESYNEIAKRTIGRWAGDRIALIGDYAEPDDIQGIDAREYYPTDDGDFTDVTDDVCAVIEHERCGKFSGEGWRDFIQP